VPLGVNPSLAQVPDGVTVMPVSLMPTCFSNYYIGHLRDGQGFVRTWYDQDKLLKQLLPTLGILP